MSANQFCSSRTAGPSKQRDGSEELRVVASSAAACPTQGQLNPAGRQDAAIPPDSNTGGKSPDASQLAFIDWLAFTFIPPSESEPLPWIQEQLAQVFNFPNLTLEIGQKGWYGYKHRIDLGHYGLLAFGGESQHGSYHIELNAHGCGLVTDWPKVKQWGETFGARITRSDLAHDDYEGQSVSIQQAIDWYEEGGFTGSGRPPKRQLIEDFDSGDGKTFYVGARENGKLCRVYEKGREQGDKSSPWVRVEVELHNKSRVIPWDIVVNPGHFLAGAYPCLKFLSAIQYKIRTIQKSVNMTYSRMVAWLKESAGKAVSLMLEVNQGDAEAVVSQILRPGRPRRLQHFEDFDIRVLIQGAI
jgi:phage replication initiation protein